MLFLPPVYEILEKLLSFKDNTDRTLRLQIVFSISNGCGGISRQARNGEFIRQGFIA